MKINSMNVEQITVTKSDEVVAIISDDEVIEKEDYKVVISKADKTEEDKQEYMKESLYKQFKLLAETSLTCDDEELPKISSTMIEVYKVLTTER